MKKMVILRGNGAKAGTYPDEQGNKIAWPLGALHVEAASEYARRRRYLPVVLDIGGYPQNQTSPQANAAVELFLKDTDVKAFYGFSGGGYNVKHILDRLATQHSEQVARIELIVVLGAPRPNPSDLDPNSYKAILKNKGAAPATWEVVYKTNPPAGHSVVPKGLDSHMFGPEWLLLDTPAGKNRDVPLQVED